MIERYGRKRTLTCDGCDDIFDQVDSGEFRAMIASAKDEGWRVAPIGDGDFSHHCPTCQGPGYVEDQRRLLGL